MAALDIVLHENEGGLVELLLGVFRQQGAVLPAQTLNVDDHQAAVLLGQLEQLQRLGDLQPQIKIIIDQLNKEYTIKILNLQYIFSLAILLYL